MKKILIGSLVSAALLMGAEAAPEESPLQTHTELSYNQTSGNTDTSSFALDFKGEKHWGEHGLRMSAFAYTAEDSGVESKNQWGVELNYDKALTETLAFNYMAAYKEDRFSGFDYQFYTGPGVVHKTLRRPDMKLTSQANILYAVDDVEGVGTNDYASFKIGAVYVWQILENLKFIEDANARTDLSDTENYFLYSKTSVQSKINGNFSMGISYRVDYANEPAAGKSTTDKAVLVSLIIDY